MFAPCSLVRSGLTSGVVCPDITVLDRDPAVARRAPRETQVIREQVP